MVDVCHPDVQWHTLWPGFESVYRGHEGIRAWGAAFLEVFENPGQEVVEVGSGRRKPPGSGSFQRPWPTSSAAR